MKSTMRWIGAALLGAAIFTGAASARGAEKKQIVIVAGTPSHAPLEHEFNAGVQILKKCLDENVPGVETTIHLNGWPKEAGAFDKADTIVLYMDGGGGHPVIKENRLAEIGARMKKGVGLVCIHYAVEVPKDKGGPEFLDWIGGYYETGYSINPHWDGDLKIDAGHPIMTGVAPFKIRDEWYYNIRFNEGDSRLQRILRGTPPDATRKTDAAKQFPGREETLGYAVERADGGRGFGFTGAHFHKNWGDDNFRKLILNSILWTAKAEIPKGGVASKVTAEDLAKNLDKKGK